MDLLTGEQLTSEYLIEHSLVQLYKGWLEALRDALVFKGVRLVTSPCGGMFSECFAGETRVFTREVSGGVSQATVPVESSSTESDLNEVAALICIAIGAGGMLLMHR